MQPPLSGIERGVDAPGLVLPAHFGDGRVAAAVFPIAYDRARELVSSPRLQPVQVFGGKALAVVCTFEYFDSPLGPYRELALGIVANCGPNHGPLSTLDLLSPRPNTGCWMLALPVTNETARQYGIELFGYPKTLASITVDHSSAACTTSVHDEGDLVLRAHIPLGMGPKIPVPCLVTYTTCAGDLLRTRIKTRWWVTLSRGGRATVEIGNLAHPLAQTLLQMNLPQSPLIVLHGERFRAILPAGERI